MAFHKNQQNNNPIRVGKYISTVGIRTISLSILLFLLCSLNAFKKTFGELSMGILYGICIIFIIQSIPYLFHRYTQWTYNWVRFFFIYIVLIGIISPLAFWYQPLIDTIHTSIGFWGIWVIFFFLFEYKYTLKEIENAIIISSIIYFILYMYNFTNHYSNMNLMLGEELTTNNIRLFWGSSDLSICTFFISLNRIVYDNKNKYFITLFLSLLIITFLQTRQIYLWIGLISIIYTYKRLNFKLFAKFFYIILISLPILIPIANGIIVKSEQQQMQLKINKEEYIRIREYKYYFNNVNKTHLQNIIGNGKPQDGSSFYNQIYEKAPGPEADVGYAGIYFYWGIIGLLFFAYLLYKVIAEKIPEKYYWIKLAIINLFLYNIFSFSLRYCFMSLFIYCIFLLQRRKFIIKKLYHERYKHNNSLLQFTNKY